MGKECVRIRRKRLGMLSDGVIHLHDNTRPQTARKAQNLLQKLKWEVWSHSLYSPDLAPSEYLLFPKLKEHLSGTRSPQIQLPRIGSMGGDVISTQRD
ncbi:hypothetical protein AVEN_204026-1 [Araneus ventricosus]|uniref:Mariner Mos1 transposase n=1 Tax=Araneus ventricosus TaxID=182803 RepID=A0A4Y2IVV9_ARAVE|nr:hypothetical protein AVEN_117711-1 [Araneus ventricosus]GBM82038.1 hypothetical protein AVEN_204026-1 [Araneus ventricosus]